MKKWKCTVCGYIHEGEEPPEKCPVCGADRSKFIGVVTEEEKTDVKTDPVESGFTPKEVGAKAKIPVSFSKYDRIFQLMVKHHVHPISVHIPNGVLPVSVLFVFLSIIFKFSSIGQAAFYNLLCVVFSMPLVLFSGIVVWRTKYNGVLTKLFLTKMICGALVFIFSMILVIWSIVDPEVLTRNAAHLGTFLLVNVIMLAAAVIAGFLGGKLVFKE